MARTKAPKGRTPSAETALSSYNKQPLCYQLTCYKFWLHIENGEKGKLWNPDETPNSVINWRSSSYIKSNISKTSFPNIFKVR